MDFIKIAEEAFATGKQHPEFRSGDTVTVAYRIIEGNKERVQQYRGVVIKIAGHGTKKRFTVRKMSDNIGVERIFPLESPFIESITVNKYGKVRRAKLYYLRGLTGKKLESKKDVTLRKRKLIPAFFNRTIEDIKELANHLAGSLFLQTDYSYIYNMTIRPYNDITDRQAIINMLRLNTPQYFSPEEENKLINYLDHHLEYYYVVEADKQIIGSGGLNLAEDKTTIKISWDIIHPSYQRKGIGGKLIQYRIEEARNMKGVNIISVRTSQLVFKFYQRFGFELREIATDYWAKGFDMYRLDCEIGKAGINK